MARPTRIPLFPLDVVLLPSMPLPLHIFEPRYTTKPDGIGMGLAHGGRLRAENNPDCGATFQVTLPVEKATAGQSIQVVIRNAPVDAVTVPTPFYKRAK